MPPSITTIQPTDDPVPEAITTHTFFIPAMDCPEEFGLIQKGLQPIGNLRELRPDYLARSIRVTFNSETTHVAEIEARLRTIGFPAQSPPLDGKHGIEPLVAPMRWTTIVAGGLLGVAAAQYFGNVGPSAMAATLITATLLAGWHVVQAAWRAAKLRSIDMNVLMTLAAAGALATGDFLEAATAMFLFAVSLWLESYSLARARRAVTSLIQLTPNVAHRLCDHGHHDHAVPHATDIDPRDLLIGDRLLVKPGERIPVDGAVEAGASAVNQAPITGESLPVEKRVGDALFAGSLNGEGTLEMRASRTAADSTLAHIARLVEQAQSARSPTERFVDRFARVYTPAVVAVALAVAFGPPLLDALGLFAPTGVVASEWFHRGLVLLVIACPCALVISTPVTIVCGLHQATRLGLLVKGGAALEAAGRIRCVAFDKTGTLTDGRLRVVAVQAAADSTVDEVLRVAAALESGSEHPLATAIVAEARDRGLVPLPAHRIATTRGAGVVGEVAGITSFVGNVAFARQQIGPLADRDLCAPPHTIAVVGQPPRILGTLQLADEPRDDAAQALAELRQLGAKPLVMLTGDNAIAAQRIADAVHIDHVRAELLPADKVGVVEQLVAEFGEVAMVGDGVNDAPALAAARLGIALGLHASDTALETADVVSLSPHLVRVPDLLRLGRRTRSILAQNIAFALTIKVGVMLLAAIGLGTLWAAVVADVGASLIVIFNGMRLLTEVGSQTSKSSPPLTLWLPLRYLARTRLS